MDVTITCDLVTRYIPLGVEDTLLLEDLGEDGDGRVDRVGDDTDESLGAVFGTGNSQISDDRGVGVLDDVSAMSIRESDSRMGCAYDLGLTKRSSRVIPGFLGTPAGMMTSSAPVKASLMLSISANALLLALS